MKKTPRCLIVVLGGRLMPLSKAPSVGNTFLRGFGPSEITSFLSKISANPGPEAGLEFQELISLAYQ